MGEDATDPFDLLQPIPAKPKPAVVPDPEPPSVSPSSSTNGMTPMGPGASASNAQRDAMRDAVANKMDEMLGTRRFVSARRALSHASSPHASSSHPDVPRPRSEIAFPSFATRPIPLAAQTLASSCTRGRSWTR
jgi:hypothetical protein